MFVFGLALLIFAEKEERMSDSEKRMLSGFPELSVENVLSGEFSSGFESFLSDGVFGRDNIVGVSESILRVFNAATEEDLALLDDIEMAAQLQGIQDEEPLDDGAAVNESETEQSEENAEQIASASDASQPEPEQDTENINGYGLFLEYKKGGYRKLVNFPEEQIRDVAAAVNSFKEFLPNDGYVFYTNIPMTKTGNIIKESNQYSGWIENLEDCFAQYAADGVHFVNSPALLEEDLVAGEHVYFRSDHHWTPYGAIKTVNECMKIQGVPAVPYDEYTYKTMSFVNTEFGTKDDMKLLYPLQKVIGYSMEGGKQGRECELIKYSYENYVAYLGGDHPVWRKYVTGFSTGRKALVIGDSFSNAFTPYLTPYYDEVHKVDARYYEFEPNGGTVGSLIQKYGIDDVYLVLSYANGVKSNTSMNKLEIMLYGNS